MKLQKLFPALLATVLSIAANAADAPTRVTVTWAPPDQLTEVKQNPIQRGQLRTEDWERELASYVQRRADRALPPGQRLDVTIDDIKLAGDYEPWHGPNAQDIRFMKEIYPPRINLHYQLIGADGRTVREASNKLLDLAYLQRPLPPTETDPLRFDKRMLDDWLKKEFRDDRTASN